MREAIDDLSRRMSHIGIYGDLGQLYELADNSDWPIENTWSPGDEGIVSSLLARVFQVVGESDPEALDQLMKNFDLGPWIKIFRTSEVLNRVKIDRSMSIELWNTRGIQLKPSPITRRPKRASPSPSRSWRRPT